VVKKVDELERNLGKQVDRLLKDRNLNGFTTLDEIGKNYYGMFKEARRIGKWRKRTRKERRKKR